jgi:uncharacterized protein
VRILLPPSEAKRLGGLGARRAHRGAGLDTAFGTAGALGVAREQVSAALVGFCGSDNTAAAGAATSAAVALALPARSAAADLAANREVRSSPTVPALDRYTGIVYEGLDASTLGPAARRRAFESVLIFSGLFGVLRADELIPAYRLPVSASLPPIGALTPFWRQVLRDELPPILGTDVVVDLRSSDYAGMWRAAGPIREQVLSVRVLSEIAGGRLAVISHPSKLGKGRLARALLSSRKRVTGTAQVAEAWLAAGGRDAIVLPQLRIDLVI